MALRRDLTKSDFVSDRIPVVNALVAFVSDGEEPSPEVTSELDQRGHSRWYPVDGGHTVKMPYQGTEPPPGPFTVEPGGWDHDHCDRCEENLPAGASCWTSTAEDPSVLCDACYRTLKSGPTFGWLMALRRFLFPREDH